MKNKLILILFLLLPFLAISQTASDHDTVGLSEMTNEFSDYHMLKDIMQVRSLSNIDEDNLDNDAGNRSLRAFCEYYYQTQQISVKIKSIIDAEHLWKNLNIPKYRSIKSEDATYYLLIDVILTNPVYIANRGYEYDLNIDITPSYTVEQSGIIPPERFEAAKAFLADSIGKKIISPTKDQLNSAVMHTLLILAGVTDYPVTATLTPTDACGKDEIPSIALQNDYHSTIINKKQYILPWYSVKENKELNIKAVISKLEADTLNKPISITTTAGYNKQLSSFDTVAMLQLMGMSEGKYTLRSTVTSKNTEVPVSGFDIVVYKEKTPTVKLIPLGTNNTQFKELGKKLNKLYEQAVINWTVEIDTALTVEGFNKQIEVGENSLLSNYSSQMNDIIKAYKNLAKIEKNIYYVFVAPTFSQQSVVGYMPIKRQFGFMAFPNDLDYAARILAHELGHGAFGLEHPEKEHDVTLYFNLMNQQSGMVETGFIREKLAKYQWDQMHNSASGMYIFKEETVNEK